MPAFELEFEAYCECKNGMCNNVEVTKTRLRNMPCIIIEPCNHCIEEAYENGRKAGVAEAEKEMKEQAA